MLHTDARPGFQIVGSSGEFLEGGEVQILNGVLVGADFIMVEIKEMDDAEVDLADFVGVVVNETDDLLSVIAFEYQLFDDLTFHAVEVGGFGEGILAFIDRIDVTADADALLGVEAFFTGLSAAGVNEIFPLMMEDGVGDDLFMGRVQLGVRAGQEEIASGSEDGVQIAFGVRLEALEGTQFIKQRAGNDKDVFYGHNGSVTVRTAARKFFVSKSCRGAIKQEDFLHGSLPIESPS